MKNKITALLNVHLVANVVMIIILACCETSNFGKKFVNGIPSLFLVHMFIVWAPDFEKAFIVPEWYISSMVICMLFMSIIFLLFLKIIKSIYATIILLGVVIIIALISGLATSWKFNENLTYDLRAWAEINIGMFAYYLSNYVKSKTYSEGINILLKIVEIIGYCLPVIFGVIPVSNSYIVYFMMITVICAFCSCFITFSGKGNIIKNEKVNFVFGYLGSVSLPIYLFHPVLIKLIYYLDKNIKKWKKFLIVFFATLVLSFAYRIIANILNKVIAERQNKKQKEENDNIKEDKNDKLKEKEKEVLNQENKEKEINNNINNKIEINTEEGKTSSK